MLILNFFCLTVENSRVSFFLMVGFEFIGRFYKKFTFSLYLCKSLFVFILLKLRSSGCMFFYKNLEFKFILLCYTLELRYSSLLPGVFTIFYVYLYFLIIYKKKIKEIFFKKFIFDYNYENVE